MPNLDHLVVQGFTENHDFKSNLSVRNAPSPQRDRGAHGSKLLRQLGQLQLDEAALARERAARGLDAAAGMIIAIQFDRAAKYDVQDLEWRRDGVEVLSVVDSGEGQVVALHVPEGRLSALEKRIRAYLNEETKTGKPKNARLITAIESIGSAAFDQLWTEDEPPPDLDGPRWYQLWLRVGSRSARDVVARFRASAERLEITVEPGYVTFPDRAVVAAQCSRRDLEQAMMLLDAIAEIRAIQPNAQFFLSDLRAREQAHWIHDLLGRCTFTPPDVGPYVTLLDTGVNRAHLLLQDAIAEDDVHAVLPEWGGADRNGHGTGMAGLLCHGDLVGAFTRNDDIVLPHRLESVKIFPPNGANPRHLYGWVFAQAVDNVEQFQPLRQRVFATMTTAIGPGAGKPSEWSATIDQMAFGLNGLQPYEHGVSWREDDLFQDPLKPRLFVLSAGNVPLEGWNGYPDINHSTSVEDPGQAWNAITVGACTNLIDFDAAAFPDAVLIAQEGGLAPASTTSLLWGRAWPIKPDLVAEGGNGALNPPPNVIDGPESLRLLTTAHRQHGQPFAETGDTSAAAAEVGRIAAHLRAHYPAYWEETIRALLVHGARFTPRMLAQLPTGTTRGAQKQHIKKLVRTYGFGKVSLENSLYSSEHAPTLVIEDTIVPYTSEQGSVKMNELKLHQLPWPEDVLLGLGATVVEMRVTLSYFIEPNPSRRGWQSKFRYQSHGLRFAVKGASETAERFTQRVNKIDRVEATLEGELDEGEALPDPDSNDWHIGSQLRSLGSIHSDFWTGTAVSLAEKSHVAVFPVGGWWKDWAGSGRADLAVRYSLIVSIQPLGNMDVDVDLYTPIRTQIAIVNEIAIGDE
ncbi:S8 family peptidase [Burkholderiaceae bacterium UC74_6]